MNEAAAAAITDDAGRLLLIRENYGRRRYGFPGGSVEPGETPAAAALRELAEETGVTGAVDAAIGVYQLENGRELHLYASSIVAGTPAVVDPGEIAEVTWFEPDAIPEPSSNLLRHALPDVVAGARDVERRGLARVT